MPELPKSKHIRGVSRDDLAAFLFENLSSLVEEEVLAVLDNPYATPAMCQTIARTPHLAGIYSVRLRLVQNRATPLAHALKLIHYILWPDLLRLSIDSQAPPQVRRSIENQLLLHVETLSLGEKIAAAKRCSAALIKVFLADPDPNVFSALLVNARLREEDLLPVAGSATVPPEKLAVLAADPKWSFRYEIRRALAMNPSTPRAIAAAQLRFLSRRDLQMIHDHPATSTYVRRCVERLESGVFTREGERID